VNGFDELEYSWLSMFQNLKYNRLIISSGSKTSTAINNGTFAQLTAITGDNRWKFWSHLVTRVFSQP
ncbi:uncharacterized protein METZ01_LOCUS498525, partial [marine metagenome]